MRRFGQLVLNLDRRIIYVLVMVFVLGPLLFPIGLPFKNTEEVQRIYRAVEALPAGSPIVISADFGPGSMAETNPIYVALLHHAFRKKLRPIIMSLVPGGDIIAQQGLSDVLEYHPDAVAGKDYVFLGFKAGSSAPIIAMTQSFVATFPVDGERHPTANLPIFQTVRKLADTKLIVSIASVAMPEAWLPYGAAKAGVPLAVSCTAVSGAQYYPYYRTGQFVGLAVGMKGSAEYEQLVDVRQITGVMPDATKAMDAQSLVHLFIVLSVILANVFYVLEKRHKQREVRGA